LFGSADWGYLRLRRADYCDADLSHWYGRIREQSWSEAYVLFKHDEDGVAPRLACRMLELVEGDGSARRGRWG